MVVNVCMCVCMYVLSFMQLYSYCVVLCLCVSTYVVCTCIVFCVLWHGRTALPNAMQSLNNKSNQINQSMSAGVI